MHDLINFATSAGITIPVILAVFLASLVQSVTGIGFGVIAGPILLATIGSSEAIQLSIILSFLIAVLLAPGTVREANMSLLKPLLIGVVLGTPVGILAFVTLSIPTLKIIAAIVVGFMTLVAAGVLDRHPVFHRDTLARRVGAGIVCGALNATLAMPGPPIAAYATAIKSEKQIVRATTLVAFLFAYPVAFVFQYLISDVSEQFVFTALILAVPTVVGTLSGGFIANIFSEVFFRRLTILFLCISVAALVFS